MRAIDSFSGRYSFPLDDFQARAIDALGRGESVLVAAPTGSGKTVVGEFAVWLALQEGGKAFYTTPLKALSNQKFGDFISQHGSGNVGLLTGDNSINSHAPAVVMTTEVLRNMIYEGSDLLNDLRYVVLDEVHYLQDKYRGAVWEEVIIHLPVDIKIVCLSATVSNAEEFADWIQTVRGATAVIIEESRPVELRHHYLVEGDIYPMFVSREDGVAPNPEIGRVERRSRSKAARSRSRRRPTVYRSDVVDLLKAEELLPAIYFIFSRKGCDMATRQCLADGLRLTDASERRRIRDFAEMRCSFLNDDDLQVLGYDRWLESLSHGLASHHAGLIPAFKETVEELFQAGLIKVVFATETLSLGINMPARSVFIESIVKFTGERHEPMTPGEFTQLTGRAGRRGIDVLGHAVVPRQRDLLFEQVLGLAQTRSFPLVSSFEPSYNMATNLVRNYAIEEAEHLLNSSFAQYHADKDVVVLERLIERNEAYLASYREKMKCDLGDFESYRRLWEEATKLERDSDRWQQSSSMRETRRTFAHSRPGQVLVIHAKKVQGPVVVLSTEQTKKGEPRLVVLTDRDRILRLSPREFSEPPRSLTALPIAKGIRGGRVPAQIRKQLVSKLRQLDLPANHSKTTKNASDDENRHLKDLREALESHPCHSCPDLKRHLQWAERAGRLEREIAGLRKRVRSRTGTLARKFERVLDILREYDCLRGFDLAPKGLLLARIYNENDLLLTDVLWQGWLEGLDAPELAAVVSSFVFESRGPAEIPGSMPTSATRATFAKIERLQTKLKVAEDRAGLELTRGVENGFAQTAFRWCSGADLDEVVEEEAAAGDFIRSMKQTLDLLKQIMEAVEEESLRATIGTAISGIDRGVIAYTGAI